MNRQQAEIAKALNVLGQGLPERKIRVFVVRSALGRKTAKSWDMEEADITHVPDAAKLIGIHLGEAGELKCSAMTIAALEGKPRPLQLPEDPLLALVDKMREAAGGIVTKVRMGTYEERCTEKLDELCASLDVFWKEVGRLRKST